MLANTCLAEWGWASAFPVLWWSVVVLCSRGRFGGCHKGEFPRGGRGGHVVGLCQSPALRAGQLQDHMFLLHPKCPTPCLFPNVPAGESCTPRHLLSHGPLLPNAPMLRLHWPWVPISIAPFPQYFGDIPSSIHYVLSIFLSFLWYIFGIGSLGIMPNIKRRAYIPSPPPCISYGKVPN